MPSVIDSSTLMPIGLVISIASAAFTAGYFYNRVGNVERKIGRMSDDLEKLKKLDTNIAVFQERIDNLVIIMREMKTMLQKHIDQSDDNN